MNWDGQGMVSEGLPEKVGPELHPKEGGGLLKRRPLYGGERAGWLSGKCKRERRERSLARKAETTTWWCPTRMHAPGRGVCR